MHDDARPVSAESSPSATSAGVSPAVKAFKGAGLGLAVLTGMNLLNFIDRYVLSTLLPSLEKPPSEGGLGLNDAQAGLLATAFIIVLMLAAPVFGTLGDRMRRPPLVAAGVAIWSIATAAGALATTFVLLLVSRAVVGIGESAYGSVAPTLLSDYYPPAKRGRVLSVFYAAIPVGSALGFALGGVLDAAFGWRIALLAVGLPGLLLAVTCLRLPDPPRGLHDGFDAAASHGVELGAWRTYVEVFKSSAFRWVVFGYCANVFAVGALGVWAPTFLYRERGIPVAQGSILFGGILVVAGLVGTLVGGLVGDWLAARRAGGQLWLCGISTLVGVPLAAIALQPSVSFPLFVTALALGEVILFLGVGPINAAIVESVPPNRRAAAMGLSVLMIHLLGDAISPPIVGAVSERTGSLTQALLFVPVALAISGIIWTGGAIAADRRARKRGQPPVRELEVPVA